jgi:peptidoglycan/xylan/chitin deacetylase (PgdA/CDA1 family)
MIQRIKNKLIFNGVLRFKKQKGRKCILMYHGIDLFENKEYNSRFFSAVNFEKHIEYYKKHFKIVSLADFFESKNLSNSRLNVAITFDDGYLNNLKYALPILEKHQAPATFFITGLNNNNDNILWSDLLDICSPKINSSIQFNGRTFEKNSTGKFNDLKNYIKENRFMGTDLFKELKKNLIDKSAVNFNDPDLLDYWQLLSVSDIKEIAKSNYVSVGSHGFYHNNLGNIDLNQAVNELKNSVKYLKELTGYEINSIGYPDGSYSKELIKEAAKIGLKYQCAVSYINPEDRTISCLENRIGLYPSTSIHKMMYEIQKFAHENRNI